MFKWFLFSRLRVTITVLIENHSAPYFISFKALKQILFLIIAEIMHVYELVNKTTISTLSVQQSNYNPLGAVDDPMNPI